LELMVPESIQAEHQELHGELAGALKLGGKTAECARGVMKIIQPHMAREEEYVAPALALLAAAAENRITDDMAVFLPRIALLRGELPRMKREHASMVEGLRELMKAAMEEKHAGISRVAQRLVGHAQEEEEILYPAAILVGEALKQRFAK
jgi:hemerythrin superfamily protein